MPELLKHLYKAKEDLDRLIRDLENDPIRVDFSMDRIYNIESYLRRAQDEWDKEAFS
jgi:hypothetical protein